MIKFIKSLFSRNPVNVKPHQTEQKVLHNRSTVDQCTPQLERPPTIKTNPTNVVKPPIKATPVSTRKVNDNPQSTEDFGTSMAVAVATNSTALGLLAGGSLSGALIGDMLRDDSPSTKTSVDFGESSSSGWSSSSSYDSSSYSSDSGSSWSGD